MEYLVYAVIMLASAALSYYAAQKANKPSNASAGTIDAPTAESGRPIPKLYGSKNIKSANCCALGDLRTEPIQK